MTAESETLAFLLHEASWPLSSILPLKRSAEVRGETVIENGYVRRGAELVVLSHESVVRERRYATARDVIDAGWRVD